MLLLNKILPLFFLPFGVVCGFLLLAIILKQRWPAITALAVLYLASIPFVSDRLLALFESRYPVVPVAMAGPADAIVVLGGILGAATPEGVVPNWLDSVERFDAGVALVQAGRAPRLVFTGARRQWLDRETTEGEELRRLAVARGVAPEKILVTRFVDNTATEATAVAALMQADGPRRIILVTSSWHMPRAAYLFRRAGIDCQPFPVDFRVESERHLAFQDFVPSGGSWRDTETALREFYGNVFYRIFR